MNRPLIGTAAALGTMAALTAVMVPFRGHLSIATTALILVVPVVIGVVFGGFAAGVVSVVVGFLAYDFFFIPPYGTLVVGSPQNWAALAVYVAVMLPVGRVEAGMNAARAEARRQGTEIKKLFELSDLLLADQPLELLLSSIVTTLSQVFDARQVAILLPERDPTHDGGEQAGPLAVVATAGEPLAPWVLERVLPDQGESTNSNRREFESGDFLVLNLSAAGRPVGLLVLSGPAVFSHQREPLLLFANHIALAVERAQLREQALQARVNEEMGRLAKTLVAAVSHDLRAPLAAIKASSSTLAEPAIELDKESVQRLTRMIDHQADRLADLVRNLLDMSRIQAGVLKPRTTIMSVDELVKTALAEPSPTLRSHPLVVRSESGVPPVDVDVTLITRVLVNLVENAARYAPKGSSIVVTSTRGDDKSVFLSVRDHGPGIDKDRRQEIFDGFARRESDAGAGLGLAIAKTFVEAHGQRIWVDEGPDGKGAVFTLSLPAADSLVEEL
jgi:two-component system, OmpR family, sensor histidine kinase KdpD